ncbi:MAG TPA: zinc metallopeptidase [Saprospiraceae bacterium]|nr:zinc metallopeptidase [Saprospiraceae bacterium]
MLLFVVLGFFALVGLVVQGKLRGKFQKYSRVALQTGLNGNEVARNMLQHYGVLDVQIVQGQGFLTDHYNPATKTVTLSPAVYQGRNVAAASVAAHECGHAVQHATQYSLLQFRSMMVPVVKVAAFAQQYLFLLALFLLGSVPQLMLVVIIAFAVTTLFSVVTLPVEFDASRRALVWLDNSGVTRTSTEYDGAKDSLKWAALTYVVAALSALAMLVYLVLSYLGSRN